MFQSQNNYSNYYTEMVDDPPQHFQNVQDFDGFEDVMKFIFIDRSLVPVLAQLDAGLQASLRRSPSLVFLSVFVVPKSPALFYSFPNLEQI